MASIKDLILSIESADSSFDEKLAAINKMEETLVAMRQQEEQAVQDNVDLIVEAIKLMEKKVTDQLEIAKSIVPEKGDKGDKGERGADGKAGRDGLDGRDGKDGRDGVDGADGVSVTDAKIDFDGSLVITLSTGREINVGEVVAPDLAEKIKVITTMSTNGAVVIKDEGTTVSGGVKSINFVGASVTATNSGDDVTVSVAGSVYDPTNVAITGGNINGTTIGGTTPAAGTFTTLTATGQTNLGGSSATPSFRATVGDNAPNTMWVEAKGASSSDSALYLGVGGTPSKPLIIANSANPISFRTTTIGGTANEQARVSHTASAVNYVQVTGAATGGSPTISAQGSDSNPNITLQSKGTGNVVLMDGGGNTGVRLLRAVASGDTFVDVQRLVGGVSFTAASSVTNGALVFQSKGTGAIDLAAGSSGVNISNGGTVTAITRTAAGSGYTSVPSVAISAPTTAGGVQATATATVVINGITSIQSGGTGYTVGDVLTVQGGTNTGQSTTLTVTSVSGGVVTAVSITLYGSYTVAPTNPASVTGGTGTGATFNLNYAVQTTFTITNAGSGYVEQPTVTFSGGGGSGATAFATVGSAVTLKSLSDITVQLPSGPAMSIVDSANPGTGAYLQFTNSSTSNAIQRAIGSNTNLGIYWLTKGTGGHSFNTNNSTSTQQMVVSHTASAVNYVQVTGAATGGTVTISAQGSDANIPLQLNAKGGAGVFTQFYHRIGTGYANYLQLSGIASGSAPNISTIGSDTNIDLALTPKGTGLVRFGTYTAGAPTATGYISIKAADGTTYKVLVGT